jgi:phenylpropionate dioxygenase-like ring-hydroxylating dioxygenase large terminal subunit
MSKEATMIQLTDHDVEAGTSSVPFAITDRTAIPRERYFDREFFELEKAKLWPHAWQMACRLEEIPNVGDFVEYRVADQSVIIVRTGPDEIKAFQNACRHRATQLVQGCGTFPGGRRAQIVCPFHGWRWHLDGSSSLIYGREGFDPDTLNEADVRLVECTVDTWANCVFITMDPDAGPLRDALDPMPSMLDPMNVGLMRVYWWKAVKLKANWKMAMEAFMEGYHVLQTHPQLTFGRGPEEFPVDTTVYYSHQNGHAHFQRTPAAPPADPAEADLGARMLIESSRLLRDGLDAMTLEKDMHVLDGLREVEHEPGRLPELLIEALYTWNRGAGIPFPKPASEIVERWGGVFYVFPNFFILPQYGNALMYRCRPAGDDPESCVFELYSCTLYPEGEEPGKPEFGGVHPPDDESQWPLIPFQDFSNIERQQRGLHTKGFRALRLSDKYEDGIANMHVELDRYLAR